MHSGPAFVPFQLSDEMYANIYRDPAGCGYPTFHAAVIQQPKFGYLFLEQRSPGMRRPKLVDGFDWIPSSNANASIKVLRDGETELVRFYCARRTREDSARPQAKPYLIFQRSVYEKMKLANPSSTSYQIKSMVGQQWRDMTPEEKQPFIDECCAENRLLRQRLSSADPQQLLVRHEMWLQESTPGVRKAVQPSLILVHYLGDDAYQCLSKPPRPILMSSSILKTRTMPQMYPDAQLEATNTPSKDSADSNENEIQLVLKCAADSSEEESTKSGSSLSQVSSFIDPSSPNSLPSEFEVCAMQRQSAAMPDETIAEVAAAKSPSVHPNDGCSRTKAPVQESDLTPSTENHSEEQIINTRSRSPVSRAASADGSPKNAETMTSDDTLDGKEQAPPRAAQMRPLLQHEVLLECTTLLSPKGETTSSLERTEDAVCCNALAAKRCSSPTWDEEAGIIFKKRFQASEEHARRSYQLYSPTATKRVSEEVMQQNYDPMACTDFMWFGVPLNNCAELEVQLLDELLDGISWTSSACSNDFNSILEDNSTWNSFPVELPRSLSC